MFYGATSFNQAINFDTSKVTKMTGMFYDATSFNQPFSASFDTSKVTNMHAMFLGATSFNQPVNFDTSKVTSMSYMFRNATLFNQEIDFDTSKVTSMEAMFMGATSFNQPVNFNTSKVISMSYMFQNATSFNQALPASFDTSNVTTMYGMFSGASSFNQPFPENFNTSNVTTMKYMFSNALEFDQPVNFNTSKVTDMSYMFASASSFNQPLITFDTTNVTDMSYMFRTANQFNQPLLSFKTPNLTKILHMFEGAVSFNHPLSSFNTSNVIDMSNMFAGAIEFNQELAFNTSKVENMTGMFNGAISFNKGINHFDFRSLIDFNHIFKLSDISYAQYNAFIKKLKEDKVAAGKVAHEKNINYENWKFKRETSNESNFIWLETYGIKIKDFGYKEIIDLKNVELENDTLIYSGNSQSPFLLNIPTNITYETLNDGVVFDVGYYTLKIKYYYDANNYEVINDDNVEFGYKVIRIFDLENVRWEDSKIYYDGLEKEIKLIGMPDELNIEYTANKATNPGKYNASYKFGIYDINLYSYINKPTEEISFNIIKKIKMSDLDLTWEKIKQDDNKYNISLKNNSADIIDNITYITNISDNNLIYKVTATLLYDKDAYELECDNLNYELEIKKETVTVTTPNNNNNNNNNTTQPNNNNNNQKDTANKDDQQTRLIVVTVEILIIASLIGVIFYLKKKR